MSQESDIPLEKVTVEFDGGEFTIEVPSPDGWTPKSVSPIGCLWESDDGEHVAGHSWDDVNGGTRLSVDGEVVAEDLSEREAAELIEVRSNDLTDSHPT